MELKKIVGLKLTYKNTNFFVLMKKCFVQSTGYL